MSDLKCVFSTSCAYPESSESTFFGRIPPYFAFGEYVQVGAKELAKRIGPVMDKIISKNQSVFIKGRMLVDGVLVVNEVVDLAQKSKK
jgi:hypothetical protein